MQDSNLDVTIGPYETYEDGLFSYKVFSQDPYHMFLAFQFVYQVWALSHLHGYTTYSFEFCPLWSTL